VSGPFKKRCLAGLLLAGVGEKFIGANDLTMQGTGNERIAIGLAGLCIGDRDAIDFQSAADGAFVVGLGFHEIGQGAEFRALRLDEVALGLNDEEDRRSTELIFLLFCIERLLLQFARLAGGLDLGAVLGKGDVGVADIEQSGVLQLLQLRPELPLGEDGALVVCLGRSIAKRDLYIQRYLVIRKIIVKNRTHRICESGLRNGTWRHHC